MDTRDNLSIAYYIVLLPTYNCSNITKACKKKTNEANWVRFYVFLFYFFWFFLIGHLAKQKNNNTNGRFCPCKNSTRHWPGFKGTHTNNLGPPKPKIVRSLPYKYIWQEPSGDLEILKTVQLSTLLYKNFFQPFGREGMCM